MRLRVLMLGAVFLLGVVHSSCAADKESAFDRVMRTNTLRCGYVVIPPQFTLDPKTGQMSGVAYDVVMEAAKRLHLKVEWTEQVNFATVGAGIASGRYDAFCLTTYRWSTLARVFDYTDPIFYSTTDTYARAGDNRFDNNLSAINDPKITVATIDGEGGEVIYNEDFPHAKDYSMPQDTDMSMLLNVVASSKADVTFENPLMAMPFLVANPGKVKRVPAANPIRAYAHALAFGKGEQELVSTFNVVLDEMRNSGAIDKILDKYEAIPHSFIRVKSPVRN
jgi:ABC-type amino acid transport substrate-binding protein